jgi:hypothetical protein
MNLGHIIALERKIYQDRLIELTSNYVKNIKDKIKDKIFLDSEFRTIIKEWFSNFSIKTRLLIGDISIIKFFIKF